MKLVVATIYIMLSNGYSDVKEVKIDPKACGQHYNIEIMGSSGSVGVRCK